MQKVLIELSSFNIYGYVVSKIFIFYVKCFHSMYMVKKNI